MDALFADFAAWDSPPVEKIALFHWHFERIHPFIDGNGRTGRLVLNLMLMQAGFPPINIKAAARQAYYDAFVNEPAMIALVAGYVQTRLQEMLTMMSCA